MIHGRQYTSKGSAVDEQPHERETLPEETLRVIEQFTDALWMERGLSRNTLTAYRNDLCPAWPGWLQKQGKTLIVAQRQDLLAYLSDRVSGGAKPRTTARMVSSMRRFYRYLIREGQSAGRSQRAH